jgi:hypothetical protein
VATFQTNVDIANRAMQHLGQTAIVAFTDTSRQAIEIAAAYDKLRTTLLQMTPWRFATRRAFIYPYTTSTGRFIPAPWAGSTPYVVGQIVQDTNGTYWICQYSHTSSATAVAGSNAPGYALTGYPAYWQQYFGPLVADLYSSSVTYNAGDLAYTGSGPYDVYISLTNGNINHAPSGGSPWQNISGSGAATTFLSTAFVLPAGVGFTNNSLARNIFPLPNGFLRFTAPDQKRPNNPFLAASAAMRMQDWEPEGNYFVSSSTTPLLVRFIADVSDVLSMTPLFCETLAAFNGKELSEPLTQSQEKFQRIAAAFNDLFTTAEQINYLEIGSTEVQEGAMADDSQVTKFPNAGPEPVQRGRQ